MKDKMRVVDVHAHVFESLKGFNGKGEMRAIGGGLGRWANGEVCRMVPPELGEEAFTYDTAYSLLKENGVEKAVLLQGSYYGFQNEYAVEAVNAHPDMFVAAGTFDPFGFKADGVYERLTHEMGIRIMKFETSSGCGLMTYHKPFSIYDVFLPVARKCEENGQVLVLDIGGPGMDSWQVENVRKIADACPDLKIVVCHLLCPQPKDEEVLKSGLGVLAAKNIWFDLAAVPFNVMPEENPYPTGLKFIRIARDIVGADKLMWGTDIPSVLWYDSFAGLRDYLLDGDVLTMDEKADVFYQNAYRVFPLSGE